MEGGNASAVTSIEFECLDFSQDVLLSCTCVHACGAHLTWELLPQRTPSPMPRALCWRRGWRWTKAINPSPPPAAPVLPDSNVPSAPAAGVHTRTLLIHHSQRCTVIARRAMNVRREKISDLLIHNWQLGVWCQFGTGN